MEILLQILWCGLNTLFYFAAKCVKILPCERTQERRKNMHRFFAERSGPDTAVLSKEESTHALRVLRMNEGDACQAILEGELYAAQIAQAGETVVLSLMGKLPTTEAAVRITLYQGLPKGDKMEFILQKCTEIGVYRFVPVLFSRCVVKWDKKDNEKKLPRWQRIVQEAAKQSGRAVMPEVEAPITVKELMERMASHGQVLVPWEEEKGNGIRKKWQGVRDVAIVIGPEGGMDEKEVAAMQEMGAAAVTLGPRILRTETAGMAAAVSLFTLSGDME